MIKNKLIALTASGLMLSAVVVNADTANVNVYGTLNVSTEYAGARNPDRETAQVADRFRMTSNSSNFGVKGTEDLGGLKTVWQLEMALNPAQGTGTLTGRNSMLGLSGDWGTVSYGKWDTPFKLASTFIEPFYGAGVGYMATVLGAAGTGSGNSVDSSSAYFDPIGYSTQNAPVTTRLSFERRQGNAIQYWTPTIAGITGRLMVSPNADKDLSNPDLISASVIYNAGDLTAAVAYEQHDDFFTGTATPSVRALTGAGTAVGANYPLFNGKYTGYAAGTTAFTKTKDYGIKAAVGYKLFGTTQLGAAYTYLNYAGYVQNSALPGAATASDSDKVAYSRHAAAVTAMHPIGSFTIRGGVGLATDGKIADTASQLTSTDTSGLGCQYATVGGSYSFSKRTDVYVVAAKIWNGVNGQYNFAAGNVTGAAAGMDPEAIGLGIRHVF